MSSKTNDVSNCKNENWLFNSANQWNLSPDSSSVYGAFNVNLGGDVGVTGARSTYGVRPALFLKSDVIILSGTGTSDNPYILE